MENDSHENLKRQLDQLLEASSENVKKSFEIWSQILNTKFKELTELHLSHVKNIGLISGTVAPFSLALLKDGDTNLTLLIIGFILLVGNIVLSQLLLSRELEIESNNLGKIMVNYVFALGEKENLLNRNQDQSNRVNSIAELANYAANIDKGIINNNQLSLTLAESHKRLTKYSKIITTIFTAGCLFIILSVSVCKN